VVISKPDAMASELQAACDSTYFYLPSGPSCAIRIGKTSFAVEQVVDNITSAMPRIIQHIPKKWKNIQALYIKTHDSVALPIFNSVPLHLSSSSSTASAMTETIPSDIANSHALDAAPADVDDNTNRATKRHKQTREIITATSPSSPLEMKLHESDKPNKKRKQMPQPSTAKGAVSVPSTLRQTNSRPKKRGVKDL